MVASKTLGKVYEGISKPSDSSAPQYWTDGITFVSTGSDGQLYFWMYHTVHTPPKVDGTFTLWAQLNPSNYTSPPDPTPSVLEAVIAAAGGRKQPEEATDVEGTENTEN